MIIITNNLKSKIGITLLLTDFIIILLHIYLGNFQLFNLDYEENIPTIYQATKLIFIAVFAFFIFTISNLNFGLKTRVVFFWGIFCLIFFWLGLDEIGQIHENLPGKLKELNYGMAEGYIDSFESMGYSSTDWLLFYIPVIFLAILFFIFSLSFLFQKNKKYFAVFLVGVLLVSIVPIVEFLNTSSFELNLIYHDQLILLEESIEMIGISFFLLFVFSNFIDTYKNLKNVLNLKS